MILQRVQREFRILTYTRARTIRLYVEYALHALQESMGMSRLFGTLR